MLNGQGAITLLLADEFCQCIFCQVSFFLKFNLVKIFLAVLDLCCHGALSRGHPLQCMDFSLWWLLCGAQALGHMGLIVAAYRFSYLMAHGIFPNQGLNLCPLHWQVDSQPLNHEGSPSRVILKLPFWHSQV